MIPVDRESGCCPEHSLNQAKDNRHNAPSAGEGFDYVLGNLIGDFDQIKVKAFIAQIRKYLHGVVRRA